MDILDSVTLQQLQTLKFPQDISIGYDALVFSPDSRILSTVGYWYKDRFVVSWDLQTGGVASVIRWEGRILGVAVIFSITYSADGRMVGVFYRYHGDTNITILISDVTSGVQVDSHSIKGVFTLSDDIWTYGGSLRFATADATTITIWEVGFTSGATPTKVETLPAPDGFELRLLPHVDHDAPGKSFLFLPTPCRLALAFGDKLQVWDVRESKCLLQYTDYTFYTMTFSSDGRFFACSTGGSGVYLWKESPTGYILHGKLVPGIPYPNPLLSRNGESIAVFVGYSVRLWRTKDFTAPHSGILTQAPGITGKFVLDFSPDGMLAVFARRFDKTVTVLNLESGVPQLTIDASVEVCGLRVIGNTVVVIGDWQAITWNLPAGDFVPDARMGLEDSSRTISYREPNPFFDTHGASISSDSRHIAFTTHEFHDEYLHIYSVSTGEDLGWGLTRERTPRFSPDGCYIWCANDEGDSAEVWRVGGGQKVLERLEQMVDIEDPPEGYPWGSSRGYRVTNDWWILGPDGKRLLMFPSAWQTEVVQQVWNGPFLALMHDRLPEPIFLELDS